MGFEVFTPTASRRGRRSEPTIRCNRKNRRISVSRAAIDLLPKACTHVVLAFDKGTRQIALLATSPTDPKGVRLTGKQKNQVGVGNFLEAFEIGDGGYGVSATNIHDRGALVSAEVARHQEAAS